MSRSIHSQDADVPPMDLAESALSMHHPRYEIDPKEQPTEIEPIEHTLREGFAKAGLPDMNSLLSSYSPYNNGPESEDPWAGMKIRPDGIKNADAIIRSRWRYEQQFFEHWGDDTIIENAPSYLRNQLRSCRDSPHPESCVEDERENRQYWYDLMTWKNLYALFTEGSSLGSLLEEGTPTYHSGPPQLDTVLSRSTNWFEGALLIENSTDIRDAAAEYGVPEEHVYHESEFDYKRKGDSLKRPDEFIETYPQPVVIGHYASSSDYLLIPWSGGLTCQCHYKHEKPNRVMCKHELFASMIAGETDSEYLPLQGGIQVPDRARRLWDPLATRWFHD